MDFSINLGKFITINPLSTGLHLAYKKPYPTVQSLQHIPHPIMSPFLVYLSSIHQSHIIWKHVSPTMWTFPYDIEESAIRNSWHIYLYCLSRQPADQEVSEWSISLIFPYFIYIS